MIKTYFTILSNDNIAPDVFRLILAGDTTGLGAGKFINIKIDGFFLRRPISVCDYSDDTLTVIYKTVGKGTLALSRYQEGYVLDVLSGLGNGFDISYAGSSPVVIGGGAGVSPLFCVAKHLKNVTAVLGFNTASEMFLKDDFEKICKKVIVTTVDGSIGIRGFVTDALKDISPSYYFACGPEMMLKAVYDSLSCDGQLSFEERMACGFGVCRGCTCKTKYGDKSICKDGPVLKKEEIIW